MDVQSKPPAEIGQHICSTFSGDCQPSSEDSGHPAAQNDQELHFVLIPLMSPGHIIPMVDIGKLLAQHGQIVSIISTPLNSARLKSTIDQAANSGLRIGLLDLQFPAIQAGLPQGCENMDLLPSRNFIKNFFEAVNMLQQPFEELFLDLQPRPSCIISGKNIAWTVETARKFGVTRIFFDGMGCFAFSCMHNLQTSKIHENLSMFESFIVPGLHHEIELSKAKLPESFNPQTQDLIDVRKKIIEVESISDGIIVNTFEELESEYVKEYKRVKGGKVWCIGPVSVCNKSDSEKTARGSMASADNPTCVHPHDDRYVPISKFLNPSLNVHECLKWLDSQQPASVVYASLGSICGLTATQLKELGLGLESSNSPFIWVTRGGEKSQELEDWIKQEGFEERIEGKGFLIRGWSPQLLILSHQAIGAFLTHCGWNSTLEGLCSGKPMITCPLFAEQFINEKFVVQVVGSGVSVGVEAAVGWGMEEKSGLVIRRDSVKNSIVKVMDKGVQGEERRVKARNVSRLAKKAVEDGGSSYVNMIDFIQDIKRRNSSTTDKIGQGLEN